MKTARGEFTERDYRLLPEGFPAQLIDGWLVKDAPLYAHQIIVTYIQTELVRLLGIFRAPCCPVNVRINEFNVFWPDAVAIEKPLPLESRDVGIPLLVVEVLSPSTQNRDRDYKTRKYLRKGVGEVWVVDQRDHSIEVHERTGVRRVQGDQAIESRAVLGFRLVPSAVFAPPRP